MIVCPKCGTQYPDGQPYCTTCGAQFANLPMGWHKALIYAIMWVSMLLNLGTAIRFFTGLVYTEQGVNYSGDVYAVFPALSFLDKGYGVACLIVVVFTLFAWFGLHGMKRGAWIYPTVMYAAGGGLALLYTIASFVITSGLVGASVFVSVIPSTAAAVGIAIANYTYYKKRSFLFVN